MITSHQGKVRATNAGVILFGQDAVRRRYFRDAREQGLATALLGVVVQTLSTRGVNELASGASAANIASLRWHLTRGFQLAPDPLRETMRDTAVAHRQGQ